MKGWKTWVVKKRRADGSVWTSPRYYQHRASGMMLDVKRYAPDTAAFFAEAQRIEGMHLRTVAREAKPGTLGGLLAHYFATDHYQGLKPRTKKDYLGLSSFLDPICDTPTTALDTPLIAGIHDRAAKRMGWRRANYLLTLIRQAVKFARPHGLISHDPTDGVILKRAPKGAGYPNRPWTAVEMEAVMEAAAPHLRLALALMANTGLDPSDAIAVTRKQALRGVLHGVRGKTGVALSLPMGAPLRAAIAAAPPHDAITLLASSKGLPWTYGGLSTAFTRCKTALEASGGIEKGLTMKGLRHTVATTLREAGVSDRDIADLLGQKTTSMAGHYSRSADLEAKNRRTSEMLDAENERRSKVVKPLRENRQTPRQNGSGDV